MQFNHITWRKSLLTGLLVSSVVALSACGSDVSSIDEEAQNEVHKVKATEDKAEEETVQPEEKTVLDHLNLLAAQSIQTDELYVTGDIIIGENEAVTPGIYDVEVTGGSGNISGDRASDFPLYINWVGGAKGGNPDYPSSIRMILLEGDVLEFSDISKVQFHAVPAEATPSNELGIGEFVVGRDILPGVYKLSTNAKLNPEYENLGWEIDIYNEDEGDSLQQSLTGTNNDVVVSLTEGELISISYYNTDHGSSTDEARLIFTEFQ